ncbi:hypothetical protein FACS1894181_02820 [Bacteroidia bacterium]|nr:hypothetical protein FACS1894181_02820 [Bacteroidia bacterium]
MYLKREREFQYHPGIEKIIEDVTGGGTISRADFANCIFAGVPLGKLPPLVVVVKGSDGIYHAIKTAKVSEDAAAAATAYKVGKNHLFAVGDAVTVGGGFANASDVVSAIDKSDAGYDVITVAGTVGAAVAGAVLVQALAKANAGSAKPKHSGELVITMDKVGLTVANQLSGLLVRGTVNESVMPFPIDAGLKAKMPYIRFV